MPSHPVKVQDPSVVSQIRLLTCTRRARCVKPVRDYHTGTEEEVVHATL